MKTTEAPNIGKGFSVTQGILSKYIALEHYCTDESKCMQTLPKKIATGDLTNIIVNQLSDDKFSDKWCILMEN